MIMTVRGAPHGNEPLPPWPQAERILHCLKADKLVAAPDILHIAQVFGILHRSARHRHDAQGPLGERVVGREDRV
ncbi:MAG: hypothetical protein U0231_03465 [Nitrospiraceae bacterium]